jgi:lysophospholipase L1-like esterase
VRLLRSLTVLATALPLAFLPATTGHAAPPEPAVYLALGDSVAAGTGATDPATRGYVGLLADDLQGNGCGKGKAVGCRIELVNLAVDGATTTSLIATQLEPALALIEERNSNRTPVDDVRLITLTIGGNDVVQPVAVTAASASRPPACRRSPPSWPGCLRWPPGTRRSSAPCARPPVQAPPSP